LPVEKCNCSQSLVLVLRLQLYSEQLNLIVKMYASVVVAFTHLYRILYYLYFCSLTVKIFLAVLTRIVNICGKFHKRKIPPISTEDSCHEK